MKTFLRVATHVSGLASIATLFFATLFVGELANVARVAVTARNYHPATFTVQRLRWSSGFKRGTSPGCWAEGLIGMTQEKLSLPDCDWATDAAKKPAVAVGQTLPVLYSTSATQAKIQGEFLRVLFPGSIAELKTAAWMYAEKVYRPAAMMCVLLLLFAVAGRIVYGRNATAGAAYAIVCLAFLGFQIASFTLMELL